MEKSFRLENLAMKACQSRKKEGNLHTSVYEICNSRCCSSMNKCHGIPRYAKVQINLCFLKVKIFQICKPADNTGKPAHQNWQRHSDCSKVLHNVHCQSVPSVESGARDDYVVSSSEKLTRVGMYF